LGVNYRFFCEAGCCSSFAVCALPAKAPRTDLNPNWAMKRPMGTNLNATPSGTIYRRIAAGIALEQMFHARRPRCQERCKPLAPYATDIRAFGEE
jgi:hypothetical protein